MYSTGRDVGGGRYMVDPGRAQAKVRVRPCKHTRERKRTRYCKRARQRCIIRILMATSQKASWTPGNPPTHECTENGRPEKERIPFYRVGGDRKTGRG